MKVKALKEGFHLKYRKVGDVFDYEGPIGSWMEVIEQPKEVVADYKQRAKELGIPLVDEDGKKRHHNEVKTDIKQAEEGA